MLPLLRAWIRPVETVEECLTFDGGTVAVHVSRRPDVEGEAPVNDDSAFLCVLDDRRVVFAVADGAGGHRRGGDASAAAIGALTVAFQLPEDERSLRTRVLDAFEAASAAVLALGADAMTTLSVVAIEDGRVRTFHAGDSGILVMGQRGKLKRQTMDHTPVGLGMEGGWLSEGEAHEHPERHLVTNVLGMDDVRIEVGASSAIAARDTLVVASDGLFDNATTDEVIDELRRGRLDRGVPCIAALARRRMLGRSSRFEGKPDDLTVVAYRPRSSPIQPRRRKKNSSVPTTPAMTPSSAG